MGAYIHLPLSIVMGGEWPKLPEKCLSARHLPYFCVFSPLTQGLNCRPKQCKMHFFVYFSAFSGHFCIYAHPGMPKHVYACMPSGYTGRHGYLCLPSQIYLPIHYKGMEMPKKCVFCVFSFHIKKHQIGVPKMKNGKVNRGPIAPTCFPLIWAGKWPKLPKNAFFVFSVFI